MQKKKLKPMKRAVTWAMAIVFSFNSATWAQPAHSVPLQAAQAFSLPAGPLHVPESLGSVETQHRTSDGAPFVIVIQDAHAVVSAQKNIQKLILYFQKKYGISLVTFEGSQGRMDPTLLSAFPDAFVKEKVFGEYLAKGELTGVEMAALSAAQAQAIYKEGHFEGLEDWELYQKNYLSWLQATQAGPEAFRKIAAMQQALDQRRAGIYSAALNEFHEKVQSFREEKTGLPELLRFLKKFPLKAEEKPHLQALFQSLDQEKEGVSGNAETTLRKMAAGFEQKFGKKINAEDLKTWNQQKQDFLTGRTDSGSFLRFLVRFGAEHGARPRLSPSLKQTLQMTQTLALIKGTKLFEELETFLDEIESGLIQNPAQKKLAGDFHRLERLKSLAQLELTPKQWATIKAGAEAESFPEQRSFYELAEQRDEAFHTNLKTLLEKKKAKAAIVVAGGFHAASFEANLKREDYSYALVMPAMDSLAGHEHYADLMQGKLSFAKFLKEDFYGAFMTAASRRLMEGLPEPDFRKDMKLWRDEIIRRLSHEGRIEEAGKYTAFIDALIKVYSEKFPDHQAPRTREEILKALEEETAKFSDETVTTAWQRFEAHFKNFVAELHGLNERKQLTLENITALLNRPEPSAGTVLPLVNAGFTPGRKPRSEIRELLATGRFSAVSRSRAEARAEGEKPEGVQSRPTGDQSVSNPESSPPLRPLPFWNRDYPLNADSYLREIRNPLLRQFVELLRPWEKQLRITARIILWSIIAGLLVTAVMITVNVYLEYREAGAQQQKIEKEIENSKQRRAWELAAMEGDREALAELENQKEAGLPHLKRILESGRIQNPGILDQLHNALKNNAEDYPGLLMEVMDKLLQQNKPDAASDVAKKLVQEKDARALPFLLYKRVTHGRHLVIRRTLDDIAKKKENWEEFRKLADKEPGMADLQKIIEDDRAVDLPLIKDVHKLLKDTSPDYPGLLIRSLNNALAARQNEAAARLMDSLAEENDARALPALLEKITSDDPQTHLSAAAVFGQKDLWRKVSELKTKNGPELPHLKKIILDPRFFDAPMILEPVYKGIKNIAPDYVGVLIETFQDFQRQRHELMKDFNVARDQPKLDLLVQQGLEPVRRLGEENDPRVLRFFLTNLSSGVGITTHTLILDIFEKKKLWDEVEKLNVRNGPELPLLKAIISAESIRDPLILGKIHTALRRISPDYVATLTEAFQAAINDWKPHAAERIFDRLLLENDPRVNPFILRHIDSHYSLIQGKVLDAVEKRDLRDVAPEVAKALVFSGLNDANEKQAIRILDKFFDGPKLPQTIRNQIWDKFEKEKRWASAPYERWMNVLVRAGDEKEVPRIIESMKQYPHGLTPGSKAIRAIYKDDLAKFRKSAEFDEFKKVIKEAMGSSDRVQRGSVQKLRLRERALDVIADFRLSELKQEALEGLAVLPLFEEDRERLTAKAKSALSALFKNPQEEVLQDKEAFALVLKNLKSRDFIVLRDTLEALAWLKVKDAAKQKQVIALIRELRKEKWLEGYADKALENLSRPEARSEGRAALPEKQEIERQIQELDLDAFQRNFESYDREKAIYLLKILYAIANDALRAIESEEKPRIDPEDANIFYQILAEEDIRAKFPPNDLEINRLTTTTLSIWRQLRRHSKTFQAQLFEVAVSPDELNYDEEGFRMVLSEDEEERGQGIGQILSLFLEDLPVLEDFLADGQFILNLHRFIQENAGVEDAPDLAKILAFVLKVNSAMGNPAPSRIVAAYEQNLSNSNFAMRLAAAAFFSGYPFEKNYPSARAIEKLKKIVGDNDEDPKIRKFAFEALRSNSKSAGPDFFRVYLDPSFVRTAPFPITVPDPKLLGLVTGVLQREVNFPAGEIEALKQNSLLHEFVLNVELRHADAEEEHFSLIALTELVLALRQWGIEISMTKARDLLIESIREFNRSEARSTPEELLGNLAKIPGMPWRTQASIEPLLSPQKFRKVNAAKRTIGIHAFRLASVKYLMAKHPDITKKQMQLTIEHAVKSEQISRNMSGKFPAEGKFGSGVKPKIAFYQEFWEAYVSYFKIRDLQKVVAETPESFLFFLLGEWALQGDFKSIDDFVAAYWDKIASGVQKWKKRKSVARADHQPYLDALKTIQQKLEGFLPSGVVRKDILGPAPDPDVIFNSDKVYAQLGDAVLMLAVMRILWKRAGNSYEDATAFVAENQRTPRLVSNENIAEVFQSLVPEIDFDAARDDFLGGVFEALMAAIYLEKGLDEVQRFLKEHWDIFSDLEEKPPGTPGGKSEARRGTDVSRTAENVFGTGRSETRSEEAQKIDFAQIYSSTRERYKTQLETAELRFENTAPDIFLVGPSKAIASMFIGTVFQELAGNALQANPTGPVEGKISVEDGNLVLEVSDHGPGISGPLIHELAVRAAQEQKTLKTFQPDSRQAEFLALEHPTDEDAMRFLEEGSAPFLTQKGIGNGGYGLSMITNFIRGWGGRLHYQKRADGQSGTVARIILPLSGDKSPFSLARQELRSAEDIVRRLDAYAPTALKREQSQAILGELLMDPQTEEFFAKLEQALKGTELNRKKLFYIADLLAWLKRNDFQLSDQEGVIDAFTFSTAFLKKLLTKQVRFGEIAGAFRLSSTSTALPAPKSVQPKESASAWHVLAHPNLEDFVEFFDFPQDQEFKEFAQSQNIDPLKIRFGRSVLSDGTVQIIAFSEEKEKLTGIDSSQFLKKDKLLVPLGVAVYRIEGDVPLIFVLQPLLRPSKQQKEAFRYVNSLMNVLAWAVINRTHRLEKRESFFSKVRFTTPGGILQHKSQTAVMPNPPANLMFHYYFELPKTAGFELKTGAGTLQGYKDQWLHFFWEKQIKSETRAVEDLRADGQNLGKTVLVPPQTEDESKELETLRASFDKDPEIRAFGEWDKNKARAKVAGVREKLTELLSEAEVSPRKTADAELADTLLHDQKSLDAFIEILRRADAEQASLLRPDVDRFKKAEPSRRLERYFNGEIAISQVDTNELLREVLSFDNANIEAFQRFLKGYLKMSAGERRETIDSLHKSAELLAKVTQWDFIHRFPGAYALRAARGIADSTGYKNFEDNPNPVFYTHVASYATDFIEHSEANVLIVADIPVTALRTTSWTYIKKGERGYEPELLVQGKVRVQKIFHLNPDDFLTWVFFRETSEKTWKKIKYPDSRDVKRILKYPEITEENKVFIYLLEREWQEIAGEPGFFNSEFGLGSYSRVSKELKAAAQRGLENLPHYSDVYTAFQELFDKAGSQTSLTGIIDVFQNFQRSEGHAVTREELIDELAAKFESREKVEEFVDLLGYWFGLPRVLQAFERNPKEFLKFFSILYGFNVGFFRDLVDRDVFRPGIVPDRANLIKLDDIAFRLIHGTTVDSLHKQYPALINPPDEIAGEESSERMLSRFAASLADRQRKAFAAAPSLPDTFWTAYIDPDLDERKIAEILDWWSEAGFDKKEFLQNLILDMEPRPYQTLAAFSLAVKEKWDLKKMNPKNLNKDLVRIHEPYLAFSYLRFLGEQGVDLSQNQRHALVNSFEEAFNETHDENGLPRAEGRAVAAGLNLFIPGIGAAQIAEDMQQPDYEQKWKKAAEGTRDQARTELRLQLTEAVRAVVRDANPVSPETLRAAVDEKVRGSWKAAVDTAVLAERLEQRRVAEISGFKINSGQPAVLDLSGITDEQLSQLERLFSNVDLLNAANRERHGRAFGDSGLNENKTMIFDGGLDEDTAGVIGILSKRAPRIYFAYPETASETGREARKHPNVSPIPYDEKQPVKEDRLADLEGPSMILAQDTDFRFSEKGPSQLANRGVRIRKALYDELVRRTGRKAAVLILSGFNEDAVLRRQYLDPNKLLPEIDDHAASGALHYFADLLNTEVVQKAFAQSA